jgi:hypothetical protein
MDVRLDPWARGLGAAGLLPLVAVVAVVLAGPDPALRAAALLIGHAYAALILSFLGGLWWGLAAASAGKAPNWLWGAAVVPSLVAFAPFVLGALGLMGVAAGLAVTGVGLLAALLVDRAVAARGLAPGWWMGLRVPLSLGLGGLSLVAAALA